MTQAGQPLFLLPPGRFAGFPGMVLGFHPLKKTTDFLYLTTSAVFLHHIRKLKKLLTAVTNDPSYDN